MIEANWEQAKRIRELEAAGKTPDEAVRIVMETPVPKVHAAPTVEKKPKKKHKYGAKPVTIDGITFASTAEGRRYSQLKLMRDNGAIRDLVLQPRYPIKVNGTLVTTYVADFRYFDNERGEQIVEDVKGYVTQVYRIKKKLMHIVHGIDITEVSV